MSTDSSTPAEPAKTVAIPQTPDPNTAAVSQIVSTLQNAGTTFNQVNATSISDGNGGRITLVDDPTTSPDSIRKI